MKCLLARANPKGTVIVGLGHARGFEMREVLDPSG